MARKAFLKRTADILEKIAVGAILVALFQEKSHGIFVALFCFAWSYYFTFLEAKK